MADKRYFVVKDAAMQLILQDQTRTVPRPASYQAVLLKSGWHLMVTHDQAWGRGAHNPLPDGWLELPHVMLGQPLPAGALPALADFGATATDTMPQLIVKMHAADPSGLWLP